MLMKENVDDPHFISIGNFNVSKMFMIWLAMVTYLALTNQMSMLMNVNS